MIAIAGTDEQADHQRQQNQQQEQAPDDVPIKSVIMLASGHIGGTCSAQPSDECRYLIVCLGGVRMPTWKWEPQSGRHVVSVGNG